MHSLRRILAVSAILLLRPTADVQAQCEAPKNWFPQASTPAPDFHAPQSDCEFHQWAWQTFLWLTKPTGPGRIQLLDLPTAEQLLQPGRGPKPLDKKTLEELKKQPLVLNPRVAKKSAPNQLGEIRQAGLRGVLVDQNGRAVYYGTHFNDTYYQFVRTKQLFLKDEYLRAPPGLNFPVGSLTIKSSWRILSPGENPSGYFTYSASIYRLACKNGQNECEGENVVSPKEEPAESVTAALVGLHVVGIVENHPEFIWATFENLRNAPDLPPQMNPDAPDPVSTGTWTFYAANTSASDCNVSNARKVKLNVKKQQLSPLSNIVRLFAWGGGDSDDQANIKNLNNSVHAQLETGSVWRNYSLIGSVWFQDAKNLEPGLTGPPILRRTTGSVRLSNTTMETFAQLGRKNCFACHDTAARDDLGLPAKNMNLSHTLTEGLLQRAYAAQNPVGPVGTKEARLNSYAEVQNLLNDYIKKFAVPIAATPYGAFWNKMSYNEFIEGNIPGVLSREGKPLRILVVSKPEESNLIQALRGTKGTDFDPIDGVVGRLPMTGPFMNEADIDQLADWIKRGCPNNR